MINRAEQNWPADLDKAELLRLLKAAVSLREQEWDAESDLELEIGQPVDGLSGIIDDLAVIGADAVTEENVNDLVEFARERA